MKLAIPVETLVADVMHAGIMTLPATETVAGAAAKLSEARVAGAPVVDGVGRIIGVVSTSDLTDPRRALVADDSIQWAMTKVVFAVRASDPAMWAVRLMVSEAVHRVVAVDDAGEPVGIVTPMDILRALDAGLPVGRDDPPREIKWVRLDDKP